MSSPADSRRNPVCQVYEQFVAGCFGLSAVSSAPPVCRVRFYTEDVTASRRQLRQQIQAAMADIYRLIVAALFQHQDRGGTCDVRWGGAGGVVRNVVPGRGEEGERCGTWRGEWMME